MGGEGEADDCFVFNPQDAAARAAFVVMRKFERGGDSESIELAAGGVEEGFGFGEFLDGDGAGVKGHGGRERARGWNTEAQPVAVNVEAFAGEREDGGVTVGGHAQVKRGAARRQGNDSFAPRDAADEFNSEPSRGVRGGQEARDCGVERVAVIGGEAAALDGKAHADVRRVDGCCFGREFCFDLHCLFLLVLLEREHELLADHAAERGGALDAAVAGVSQAEAGDRGEAVAADLE